MAEKGRVCVTGAGGYIASWLVKLLLSNGYTVHGTVRDPRPAPGLVGPLAARWPAVGVGGGKRRRRPPFFLSLSLSLSLSPAAVRVCVNPDQRPRVRRRLLPPTDRLLLSAKHIYKHDEKNAHLMKFEKASENLKLFKVDLLDRSSVSAAIKGCDGVFHVATPVPSGSVPNPEVQLIEPAVKGTLNVLEESSEANAKKVVVVSSGAAVVMNPAWPEGQAKNEACWSDKEYCRKTNSWYCLSKTEAESEALDFAKRSGLDVVTVCPTLVLGPKLQSSTNASSLVLIKLLKEGYDEVENRTWGVVDVRDVAEALLLAYEKPEAKGRYICAAQLTKSKDMVEIVRKIYPNYNYPKKFIEGKDSENLSSEKLQKLGWRYRALEETLVDSVESYIQGGLLD